LVLGAWPRDGNHYGYYPKLMTEEQITEALKMHNRHNLWFVLSMVSGFILFSLYIAVMIISFIGTIPLWICGVQLALMVCVWACNKGSY